MTRTSPTATPRDRDGRYPDERRPSTHSTSSFLAAPPHTAEAQRLYDDDVRGVGYVTNVSRLWAHRPQALDGLAELMAEVTRAGSLTPAQRSVLVTAAASASGDSYCSMAWGNKLAKAADADVAAGVIRGDDRGLDEPDQALAEWARLLATDPNGITADDVQALRAGGFDDSRIFAITVYVALRLAFSTVNDALGAAPDLELASATPEPVRSAIVFGRAVDRQSKRESERSPARAAGLEQGADQ